MHPKRVVKLFKITSGLCSEISLWLRFKSTVNLTLLSLKCAVGPSGKWITNKPSKKTYKENIKYTNNTKLF